MKFFRDPIENNNLTEMGINANPYELTGSVQEAIDAHQNKGQFKLAGAGFGAIYLGTIELIAVESNEYVAAAELGVGAGVVLLALSGVKNIIEARRARSRAIEARRSLG